MVTFLQYNQKHSKAKALSTQVKNKQYGTISSLTILEVYISADEYGIMYSAFSMLQLLILSLIHI